jgi:NAD(P)-dependent dehydrogenase (short-subunit alcohol dehydrogenase family)
VHGHGGKLPRLVLAGCDLAGRDVGNAGVSADQLSVKLGMEDIDALLSINLKGLFLTAREGARRLIAAGSAESGRGRIVLIGSITADKVYTGTSLYAATKAGVKQLGRVMAREWTRKGINVNTIQPGYIETEMTGDFFTSGAGDPLIATFPRRRLCPIEALDAPLLYFAGDLSAAVTGSFLTVDDGQSL